MTRSSQRGDLSTRLPARALRGPRLTGFPTSSNGASSFHLRWMFDAADAAFTSVSVTFEVVELPTVERLYFWALQADFGDDRGRRAGGAHLGLQWHPEYPGSTAVNWGGYDARGQVLHGSESALASTLHNPHTRDISWSAGTPYRLTIEPSPDGAPVGLAAWRGSVTDLATGARTVVRDLYPVGDRITGVTMWSEVFARCDDPPAAVRWSRAEATTVDGRLVRPRGFVVNYQADHDGGCANTDSSPGPSVVSDGTETAPGPNPGPGPGPRPGPGGPGIVQRTCTPRSTAQGEVIRNL